MLESRPLVLYVVATGCVRPSIERDRERERWRGLGARKHRKKAHVRSPSERILSVVTCAWKCLEIDNISVVKKLQFLESCAAAPEEPRAWSKKPEAPTLILGRQWAEKAVQSYGEAIPPHPLRL